MDEEGRAYEDGYEQGFIDGMQKNAESKVTQFIDQGMRKPLTEEVLTKLWGGFPDDMTRQQAMSFARAVERTHGIGEKE
jgi:hypothetical protein